MHWETLSAMSMARGCCMQLQQPATGPVAGLTVNASLMQVSSAPANAIGLGLTQLPSIGAAGGGAGGRGPDGGGL